MQGFVYKQSYKMMRDPKTRVSNVKHLEYIATRPGTRFNTGCNFGLFGKLSNMQEMGELNNLSFAKSVISAVSKRRTVYRTILSLDHETALNKGFYKRSVWEEFLKSNIDVITKNMGIEVPDFNYMAAMHYKKGHPHTHIVFWDNGVKVRQEHISKERFEIMTERIRGQLSKGIFKEEITNTLNEQKELISQSRLQVMALLKELNPIDVLAVERIDGQEIQSSLAQVLESLCTDKNRRYAYLRPESKQTLNRFTDCVFSQPQFKGLKRSYLAAAKQVNEYYANNGESGEHFVAKALDKLYTEVGNEFLKFVKETDIVAGYRALIAPDTQALLCALKDEIKANPELCKAYEQLLSYFPPLRTPLKEIVDKDFYKLLNQLAISLTKSPTTEKSVKLYVENQINMSVQEHTDTDIQAMKEEKNGTIKKQYGQLYTTTRQMIMDSIYSDVGYGKQWMLAMSQNFIISLFECVSQSKSHMVNQRDYNKNHKELSDTALKDLRARLRNSQQEREF